MKALGVLLSAFLVLTSCTCPLGRTAVTPWVEKGLVTPTPTLAVYWDLLPLDSQPEGGWRAARIDEVGLAFQYPAVYDQGDCGRIFVVEKALEKEAYTLVGFEGGTIRIRIFDEWADDSAVSVSDLSEGLPQSDAQLLTAVERFTLDGVPAFRYILHEFPGSSAPDYVKIALAAFGGKLYQFQYNHVDQFVCDAPPLSEEAVYEYLLSTVEFND